VTNRPSLESDREIVAQLLGREPSGAFIVVVRNSDGRPVVLRNAPFLDDGTPMPTLFWLCDPDMNRLVSRLEAEGGVRRAEQEIPSHDIEDAHRRYAELRNSLIDMQQSGPRPSGGVAGTRTGVKCLHAHYAWHLAGGDDPVGRWVESRLTSRPDSTDN
jgi:uncharacterized protein